MRLLRRGDSTSSLDLLVVGLGNPGREYRSTPHNVGFLVLEEILRRHGGSYRSKFSSNPSRSIYTDVAGYSIANFRAGFRTDSGWDVYGWVRNAFDDVLMFPVSLVVRTSTPLMYRRSADPS